METDEAENPPQARRTMSYTRKRALLACDFCRHRKRRCDGKTPCSTCVEADADCSYPEPQVEKIETSSTTALLDRLKKIEKAIEEHSSTLNGLASQASPVASQRSDGNIRHPQPPSTAHENHIIASSPAFSVESHGSYHHITPSNQPIAQDGALPPLLIPQRHETSTNKLMSFPKVRALIGDYPDDYFYVIEATSEPFPTLNLRAGSTASFPVIDRQDVDPLVAKFYSDVNPLYPILDQDTFIPIYERILQNGLNSDIESAVCLLVFALGAIASNSLQGVPTEDLDGMSLQYFEAALPIVMWHASWSFLPSIMIPQALILGSVYFAYLARPLQSWRLVYLASTNLQLITSRPRILEGSKLFSEEELRIFWSCFLIECDRLAELELPRSGIEILTDDMPLPSCGDPPSTGMLYFLAEISIRRLLNRIHNSLYGHNTSQSASAGQGGSDPISSIRSNGNSLFATNNSAQLPTLLNICAELNRQLEIWHESIPAPVRPTLGLEQSPNERARVLRIRYYAAKHIIHRPFVLYAADQASRARGNGVEETDPVVLEHARTCLDSCRLYLLNVSAMLDARSQYTWTFSQSSLGALLVLSIAHGAGGPLREMVQADLADLQGLLIDCLGPWATARPGSSFESIIWIVSQIRRKQAFWDGRGGR